MKVVFLCIGAAKAGTSWLHQQLMRHPDCHFRTIKELHYFNALENGSSKDELKRHTDTQREILRRLAKSDKAPTREQNARIADRAAWIDVLDGDLETPAGYLKYLYEGGGKASVVGEMTPAYALLPEARLSQMATLAPDVRFLYLLRDPVERLWSHVRMIASRRSDDGEIDAKRCARVLDRTLSGEETQIAMRSDYASSLARLSATIQPTRLLIEVFEEMVQGDGFTRICEFLGIRPVEPDPIPVYEGPHLDMSQSQRQAAARWLEPQYAAAEVALGRMPALWAKGEVR